MTKRTTLLAAACILSCGARTELTANDTSQGTDAGHDATPIHEASTVHDAPVDIARDVATPPLCRLDMTPTGEPMELVRFDQNNANAPELVVLDPGGNASPRDAVLAIQVFRSDGNDFPHPDIQIARVRIGALFPHEVSLDRMPQLFGIESHGWGEMVHAPNADGVALAWHGDPGGRGRPMFRALDAPSWTEASPLDIALRGDAVIALAAGAGTRDGAYEGDGYAVAWRSMVDMNQVEPLVALLDRDGRPAIGQGPFQPAVPSAYPGVSMSMAWSGQTYLTATAYSRECMDGPRCGRGVIVGSVRPSNGRDTGAVINTATFWGQTGGPIGVRIASYGGITWITWFEGDPDVPTGPRTLRLARVAPSGESLGAATTIAEGAHPQSRLALVAAETGVTIAWIEDGDVTLGDEKSGRSRLRLLHGALDGTSFAELTVPITRFASYGIAPTVAAIASPRGIVVSYTARGRTSPMSPAWLMRFGCLEK
jgi:hypothetical protein